MSKKKDDITQLITSGAPELINSRFLVKASVMNNGVDKKSIMLVVTDLVESAFTIKFFKDTESASQLLKLLHIASE